MQGIPATLFLDENGDQVGEIGGYLPADKFLEQLKGMPDSAKKYKETLAGLQARLGKDANDVQANFDAAKFYLDHQAMQKAVDYFTKVIDLDKDNAKGLHAETHYRLGFAQLVKSNDIEGARKHFAETAKVDPKNEKGFLDDIALLEFKITANQQGSVQDLLASIDKFLTEFPKSELVPEGLLYKGEILFQDGKKAEGLAVLEEIVKQYPKSEQAEQAQSQIIPAMKKQIQEGSGGGGEHPKGEEPPKEGEHPKGGDQPKDAEHPGGK